MHKDRMKGGGVSLYPSVSDSQRGVGLVEALVGIMLVVIASIATLTFFSYGVGHIRQQGARRAALEVARQRLDQLLIASVSSLAGSNAADGTPYWVTCTGTPCAWGRFTSTTTQAFAVPGGLTGQIETTVQRVNDPFNTGTDAATPDVLDLSVQVWYTNRTGNYDDYNRVILRTTRAQLT